MESSTDINSLGTFLRFPKNFDEPSYPPDAIYQRIAWDKS
jgi:hypothetical protein